ncbi:MAG: 1-deoxy-D-xylulose-5-phosphate reductoisomerase [Gemmatimonadota bacterium]
MSGAGLVLLGATGSIGESTLDVVADLGERFRVVGLSCHRRWRELALIAERTAPQAVAIADVEAWREAREEGAFEGLECLPGPEGVTELARREDAAIVLNGIVGAAGLGATLAALAAGKRVALANKESLVVGGELVMRAARGGDRLQPVDSEHNAIWQLMRDRPREQVQRIVLTASGGPFREMARSRLADVTPQEALAHPTWSMGPKITVDSATLANKGLEIIEAHHLFGLDFGRIDVVIHPQSIVHGLVECVDGTLFAELGAPDMRAPIRAALTWPDRIPVDGRADLTSLSGLTFEAPDPERFPALGIARAAGQAGGTAPAVFNAVNEVAVSAFLAGRIRFPEIPSLCESILSEHDVQPADSVETLFEADRRARALAGERAGVEWTAIGTKG